MTEYYMYDATNLRLREVSLSYNFSKKWIQKTKVLKLSLIHILNDWLTIQARGNMDYWADKLRQKFYASTATALCGANGRYIEMDYQETQMYGDVMAMVKKTWGDFTPSP